MVKASEDRVRGWETRLGRQAIDNNVERDLRRLTIVHDNRLFVGHPEAGPPAAMLKAIVARAAHSAERLSRRTPIEAFLE